MERSNLSFCGRIRPSLDASIPELAVLHASVNAVLKIIMPVKGQKETALKEPPKPSR
jgi:hypothetical protein